MPHGKYNIELYFTGDVLYMNWWNWMNGDDVTAEIRDGKIYVASDQESEEFEYDKEVTFAEYLVMVTKSIDNAQ